MLISTDISYLLERMKGNSMLDGGKTNLGINTLWSALLPVTKYPSISFGYIKYVHADTVSCLFGLLKNTVY